MALKDKPEIRYALWQAYQRRCSICKENLFNFSDLEIDHIIPRNSFNTDSKKKDILNKYNLPTNFEFEGLENLRPAHHKCNNNKRAIELTEEIILGLITYAKNKIKDVDKFVKKYHEEAKYALNVEFIRKQLDEGIITFEEYADQINNFEADFGENDYRSFTKNGKFLKFNNKSVVLEGYLPIIGDNSGSCLFTFKSFYIKGTLISLNYKEILSELYPGNNTPIEFELRKYIAGKIDDDNFLIQLGNSRFNLNSAEVINLCNVIDKFIKEYIASINEIEETIESKEFTPNYYDSSKYQLIKVEMEIWNKIIEFSRKYDYEKGNSKWNIFDATGNNMLKIYVKGNHEVYSPGYKCIIHSFIENHYSWTPSDYVWLLWNDMSMENEYGINGYWTVKYAYNWLKNELLPEVIGEKKSVINGGICRLFYKKNQLNNSIQLNDQFSEGSTRYINKNNTKNINKLIGIVNEIQVLYSTNEYFAVPSNALVDLYKLIIKSLYNCNNPDYHYICLNLNIEKCTSKHEIEKNLKNEISKFTTNNVNEQILEKIYSYKLDLYFRVIYSNLTYSNGDLDNEELQDYLILMDWFINHYNTIKLVECYK